MSFSKIKILAITAAIFLAAVGLAFADGSAKNNFATGGMMGENFGMGGMMMGNMMDGGMMAHHNSDNAGEMQNMDCMEMMKNSGSMSIEEKEKMLADMDKDGDGFCDMCGMLIEMCRKMMGL